MCQRNRQLDFQGNWAGVSASVSASVQYTAAASSGRKNESIYAKGNMQRKPAKSLKVCHTFKVGSRLSPNTFWICFRAGENLKEPESDLYGFAMAQRITTKVI
jgi:hypothetical protein